MLSFEAPLVCSLTTFAAALLFFFSWRIARRPWWVLMAVFGWLSWTIFFALLAITAGPAPMIERADITAMVRWAEMLGGVLIAVWLWFWFRHGIRGYPWYTSDISDDKDNYLREDGC
jgi:hypothetical protein